MSAEIIEGDLDRGYWTGVNMDEELFANVDGLVYPIVEWRGPDAEPCPKEDAVFAIAGRGFRWFCVHLGEFGIGPWVERYKDPAFLARIRAPCDSGSRAEHEDSPSEAEPEGRQSGGEAASSEPSPHHDGDHR
jgi:hypothetical protein